MDLVGGAQQAREAPTVRLSESAADLPAAQTRAADMLAAGSHDITETLASDSFKLNQVLRRVLETMHLALGFQHMVFCLRDGPSGRLTRRFGWGSGPPR